MIEFLSYTMSSRSTQHNKGSRHITENHVDKFVTTKIKEDRMNTLVQRYNEKKIAEYEVEVFFFFSFFFFFNSHYQTRSK
jgi:hypothetical protein